MRPIAECFDIPVSAPTMEKVGKSKSKKLFKYEGLHFFMTESKADGFKLFSIELGKQVSWGETKTKAMKILHKHIDELKELINELDIQR